MNHFAFGKHRVSNRQLKKNILSVSTGAGKSQVSSRLITDAVKTILLDFRDNGKFNCDAYLKLKGDDKKVLDDLLVKSNMDDQLGIRIRDDELNELVDRYELLRGQVLAGNDATEIRKELKYVVLKLVRLGKLPLRRSHDLLLELALLE